MRRHFRAGSRRLRGSRLRCRARRRSASRAPDSAGRACRRTGAPSRRPATTCCCARRPTISMSGVSVLPRPNPSRCPIAAGPGRTCGPCLVDDGDLGGGRVVRPAELPARHERDAERREVVGPDGVAVDLRTHPSSVGAGGRPHAVTQSLPVIVPSSAAVTPRTPGRRQALGQPPRQRRGPLRGVAVQLRGEGKPEDVVRAQAELDLAEIARGSG